MGARAQITTKRETFAGRGNKRKKGRGRVLKTR